MPVNLDGSLRQFTDSEWEAFEVQSMDVRRGAHPTETREVDRSTMTRPFKCLWESRYDVATGLTGDSKLWDDSGTTRLSRMLPHPNYGRHPEFPEIICTKITSIQGFGRVIGVDDNGFPVYPHARIDAYFEHFRGDSQKTDDDILLGGSEFARFTYFGDAAGTVQGITLPGGSMRFWRDPAGPTPAAPPNGIPVPYGVTVSRAEEEFTYTWCAIPFEAFDVTSALYTRVYGSVEGDMPFLGSVNRAPIFDRPEGTVVFAGVTPKLELSQTGTGKKWSIVYKFAYSASGWNWLFFNDPTGANSGWFVVNNKEFQTADILEDHRSLTPGSRDLNLLFSVG